jgi:UDP-N-acetylglucosamine:LPS N-acetylglucosamine transferase
MTTNHTQPRKPKLMRINTSITGFNNLLVGQPRFMQEHGFDVVIVSNDGEEVPAVLAREQVRHVVVPMARAISLVSDLKCLWRLIRLMRREKPDIVHTNSAKASLLGMMAAWWCRIPVRLTTIS